MKTKIGHVLIAIILYVLAATLTLIVSTGLVYDNEVMFSRNPIIVAIGVLVYIPLTIVVYKKILPWIEKIRHIEWIIIIIFTILTVSSGMYFKLRSNWDMAYAFNIAENYMKTGEIDSPKYLAFFPNNTMLAIIEIIILIISKTIGYSDYIGAVTIANALSISLAVAISYLVAKKLFGRKNGIMHLLICLLTSPLYLYAAVYYTDTFSLPIGVGLIYLWLVNKDINKISLKILLNILIGLILFIGIKLKILSIFVFIAISLYEILTGNIKEYIKDACVILPVMGICIILFNTLVLNNIVSKKIRSELQIPIEHWIMMGLNGNGNYSLKEYIYTARYKTYEERQVAVREKIIYRLTNRELTTHLRNAYSKLVFVWHDGSYWVPEKLSRGVLNNGILHEFVLKNGKYVAVYKYIPQIMHFTMLIYIITSIIKNINAKAWNAKDNILHITIFGMIVFLLIWETRSRFLINILLFMIMTSVQGIEYVSKSISKEKLKILKLKTIKANNKKK